MSEREVTIQLDQDLMAQVAGTGQDHTQAIQDLIRLGLAFQSQGQDTLATQERLDHLLDRVSHLEYHVATASQVSGLPRISQDLEHLKQQTGKMSQELTQIKESTRSKKITQLEKRLINLEKHLQATLQGLEDGIHALKRRLTIFLAVIILAVLLYGTYLLV